MAYYLCPNCKKAINLSEIFCIKIKKDCRYCGYKGDFSLVILKHDLGKIKQLN